MEKKNLVRLFMFQSVNSFANSNAAITNTIPAFKSGNIQLGSIISQITAISGSQSLSIKGTGAQKELARTLLNDITANTIKATRGWAISQNQMQLAAQLNYSPTRIQKISDKNISERASNWLGLVNAQITHLSDWDVIPATIIAWQAAIDNYDSVINLPKTQREERKYQSDLINTLIKQGMNYCRNILDSAAIGFKSNGNLAFYTQYKSYRRLDQVASKFGKFRVLITDELKQPIVGATLSQDNTTNKITTDINGHASLDIIYNKNVDKNQLNLYSFTITSGKQSINTGITEIKHNETVSRTYIMAASGFIIPAYQPQPVTDSIPA